MNFDLNPVTLFAISAGLNLLAFSLLASGRGVAKLRRLAAARKSRAADVPPATAAPQPMESLKDIAERIPDVDVTPRTAGERRLLDDLERWRRAHTGERVEA